MTGVRVLFLQLSISSVRSAVRGRNKQLVVIRSWFLMIPSGGHARYHARLFSPPKQHAVTLRAVGNLTTRLIVPSLANRTICEPPHLHGAGLVREASADSRSARSEGVCVISMANGDRIYRALQIKPSVSTQSPSQKEFSGKPRAIASTKIRRLASLPSS